MDSYFRYVDYVQLFNILGGESFLYPMLDELIDYIVTNYGSRIGKLELFTNGLARISNELLKKIKRNNISIQLSDYRNGIPQVEKKIDELTAKLTEYGINYRHYTDNKWISFGFPDYKNCKNEEQLIKFFDECYAPFRGIWNKKLYYCHLEASAIWCGMIDDDLNDYFNLDKFDSERKIELLEFDLGYTEKGFVSYCKKCKGCFPVNNEYVDVANQKM